MAMKEIQFECIITKQVQTAEEVLGNGSLFSLLDLVYGIDP